MKVKHGSSFYKPTIDSDKENIHPNIMRNSQNPYPKVSSFTPEQNHSPVSDWKVRLLQPSDREKALDKKLSRMLSNDTSPTKRDKMATEAASQSRSRMNLGNTLWRYLYERSINSISLGEKPSTDLME